MCSRTRTPTGLNVQLQKAAADGAEVAQLCWKTRLKGQLNLNAAMAE
jgi:hypothetical protein